MSRLFTFGCSFTQYMWPTWATIVGYDTEAELINFALPGLGNVGIHHRIIEADIKYNFTPEDKIMILWSSFSREDRFANGQWQAFGSVFNTGCKYNNRKWIRDHWSLQNDLIKNMTAIITINKLYKDLIVWQGHSFPPLASEAFDAFDDSLEYIELKKLYNLHDDIPWHMWETVLPFGQLQDSHPDVAGHLDKVQNWIYPKMNKTLKESTVNKFKQFQLTVSNYVKQNNITENLDDLYPYVIGLYQSSQFKDIYPYMCTESVLEKF